MNKESHEKHDNLYIGVFVPGLAKCGTSTIANWLFQHPQMTPVEEDPVARELLAYPPLDPGAYSRKEPRIMLSRTEGAQIDWEKGRVTLPILDQKPLPFSRSLTQCLPQTPQTRPDNWQTIAVDCSPQYLIVPACAKAIKALYPDARIIITLRYPVDWFYSWHCMRLRDCLALDNLRLYQPPTPAESFSRYIVKGAHPLKLSERLAEWFDTFDRDQIKVIILEEWSDKLEQTARECYRFIGVDDTFKTEIEHANRGGEKPYPVYPVSWAARQSYRLCWVTNRLARKMGALGLARKIRYTPVNLGLYSCKPAAIDQRTRDKMNQYFRPQIQAIEQILGRTIPAWHRDE